MRKSSVFTRKSPFKSANTLAGGVVAAAVVDEVVALHDCCGFQMRKYEVSPFRWQEQRAGVVSERRLPAQLKVPKVRSR